MRFLALFLLGQIILSLLLLSISPPMSKHAKKVLGIQIAQEPDATPEATPEVTTKPSVEEASPTSEPTPQPVSTVEPNSTPKGSPDPNLSSNPDVTNLSDQINNNLPQDLPIPNTSNPESLVTQTVLSPDALLSNPDNINSQIIDQVQKQDEQVEKIQDPNQKAGALLSNTISDIQNFDRTVDQNDFASTNFVSQRFNHNLDQVLEVISKQTPIQANQTKKQFKNLCNQVDLVLRSLQLSVPEDEQQDLDINRGRCLSL